MKTDPRHHLGRLGEQLAAEHLERLGYRVLARNHRTRWGELDLVVSSPEWLVFCEVKTRRLGSGDPWDSLHEVKRSQVRKMASAYLVEGPDRPWSADLRFDAVGVVIDAQDRLVRLDHLEGGVLAMLARVTTFALDGVESRRVWVEADIRSGLPAFTVVGLADKAVREARERVRAAMVNSGFEFPNKRITVNLAPAYLTKVGPGFDLPLAVAVLAAAGQVPAEGIAACAMSGELSLAGEIRPVRGALAIAEGARRHGLARLVLPRARAREAALVEGLEVCGVESLREVVDLLHGRTDPVALEPLPAPGAEAPDPDAPDLSDVRGHNALIGAIEAAAAGGHNLFLHGPPGTGKTMLARRIPSILPPLAPHEAIGVTRIHSIAGLHDGAGLVAERPFRAPHHTVSASGLVGGGSSPMPGEVTLAHHGVLFLDELSEFPRSTLEALRQPLEDGRVAIVRGQRLVVYPSRCMLVAAANPCPCGMGGRRCRCTGADLSRHERRLSGPLLDRIDISLWIDRPSAGALETQAAEPSAVVRARVIVARERQARRFAGLAIACNAEMTPRMLSELAAPTPSALRVLYRLHDQEALSARGHARVLRVARTLADLAGSDVVHPEHVSAAAAHRTIEAAAAA